MTQVSEAHLTYLEHFWLRGAVNPHIRWVNHYFYGPRQIIRDTKREQREDQRNEELNAENRLKLLDRQRCLLQNK